MQGTKWLGRHGSLEDLAQKLGPGGLLDMCIGLSGTRMDLMA